MDPYLRLRDAAGSFLGSVSLEPGRDTARDVLGHFSDEQLARWKALRPYAALVPWTATTRWTRANIFAPETNMRLSGYCQYSYDDYHRKHESPSRLFDVALLDVRTIPPETVDAEWLTRRLPHIGESTRGKLLERLLTFAPGQLDLDSIEAKLGELN